MRAYDEPDPRLLRLQAWLMASFRLGRWFGIEVRMFWAAAILMPLLIWPQFGSLPAATERLLLTVVSFAGLFGVVLLHEFGHALWARRYGIRTPLITLSPLGGLAHLGTEVKGPRQELLISLAGPATHLLLLAVLWPLQKLLPWGTVEVSGWAYDPLGFTLAYLVALNQGLLLFNLLPSFPLDGGRALRAVLAMRMHPNRATMIATSIGIGGAAALIVWGIVSSGMYVSIRVLIGVGNLQACLRERLAARHVLVYGDGAAEHREPWQSDPDAWRRGDSPFGVEPRDGARTTVPTTGRRRGPNAFARVFARLFRRPDRAARAQRERAELDAEVDRVLERVQQIGMAGLSAKERKVLQRASRQRRGAG
jgi:Zn-dependent protease